MHKKWSFPLRIFSVNVTKSAVCCGFGHIYWRNPKWKTSFFVQCTLFTFFDWFHPCGWIKLTQAQYIWVFSWNLVQAKVRNLTLFTCWNSTMIDFLLPYLKSKKVQWKDTIADFYPSFFSNLGHLESYTFSPS